MTDRSPAATRNGPAPRKGLRRRLTEELTAFAVIASLKLLLHAPERPLWRLADVVGGISYRASSGRRDQSRRNLRRIVEWMAANGRGSEAYRRAAGDPKALEELVKSSFRNHIRYYVEMARAPKCTNAWVAERMIVENLGEVDEWLTERRALIVIGMHFGAIEMPGFYAVNRLGEIVAPMETVSNARIQRYVFSTRATNGVRIVSLEAAGAELLGALRRNEPVGLIADRDITGAGLEVEMFGGKTKIPAGPMFLAAETGAPMYLSSVRRARPGHYLGKVWQMPAPVGANRRERMRSVARDEARVFEEIIIDAPEQWLALFHPIWPDLEQPTMVNGENA
jgi:lauroyl/myristoyl acyltransferase